MATGGFQEAGVEPASPAPATLLSDVLAEGLGAIKTRGYAILKLSKAAHEAIDRLRTSQLALFQSTPAELKVYSRCHTVMTHGISEVADLKYYFQARAGGSGSKLPFPSSSSPSTPDFGIACTDTYVQLDLLGRACLAELAPALGADIQLVNALLDPIGKAGLDVQKLSRDEILALKFDSKREDDKFVSSELLVPNYVSSSNLDLFHYHNIESTREKWLTNHPSHTDSGIISFIPVSTIPALDFLDQKLALWIEIERTIHEQAPALGTSYQDYVVAMAGDTLEWLAKGSFKAGLHRVVRTEEARQSAVYKMRARPELVGPKYEVDYVVVQVQRKALGLPEL